MDNQNIQNQIKINQTKLQVADTSDQKAQIQKQLIILNLKQQIQILQDRIDQLQSN
jgi:hypothetical protein